MPQKRSPQRCNKMMQLFLTFLGGTVLANGLPGLPPANTPSVDTNPAALPFFRVVAPAEGVAAPPPKPAKPIKVVKRRISGISFYQTTIDLKDPKTFVTIGLANNAKKANSAQATTGSESFRGLVNRQKAAVVASGTFFSMDWQKRIMGNMVAGGKMLKYSPWENYGTTLGIRAGNQAEMVTARVDGKPNWNEHWFSLTAGPRLLNQGEVWIAPKTEGFRDPRVLGRAQRSAIGFPKGGKTLVLVTFLSNLSLEEEAKVMRKIGCYEAMNLDGGSSLGLAKSGKVLLKPSRELTNVIVAYDTKHPAPKALKETWTQFQKGGRLQVSDRSLSDNPISLNQPAPNLLATADSPTAQASQPSVVTSETPASPTPGDFELKTVD
jgi:exopolysaccharide biosynthesis protein